MVNSCFICGTIPDAKENGVRTFRADEKVLQWQEVILKNGLTQWSRLCTRHFDPGDIVKGKTIQNIFYPNKIWKLQIGAIPKHCLGIPKSAPACCKPLVSKSIASAIKQATNEENKTPCRGNVNKQKHAELPSSSNTSNSLATTSNVFCASDLFDDMQHSTTQASYLTVDSFQDKQSKPMESNTAIQMNGDLLNTNHNSRAFSPELLSLGEKVVAPEDCASSAHDSLSGVSSSSVPSSVSNPSIDRNPIPPLCPRPRKSIENFCQTPACRKKHAVLERMVQFERKRANHFLELLKRCQRKKHNEHRRYTRLSQKKCR
ncbi:hypothetical protein GHT06_022487 [Daphnia sinensis]|uniref:THAP-type domain-containing protein n=1 Tax=Daphnia sinensis TaxID=1820382 RepID=A0AAD5PR60_9CRUS|nr:hypothetical protein GHT06_022487 [Daphnia sinensis]